MLRFLLVVTAAAVLRAPPLVAQSAPFEAYPRGVVVERVTSRADSSQSYALYLPSAYDSVRRWPVLFLMDPRGRALVPLELFREAAERHGYVVLSAYGTASDTTAEPNERAMAALLADAQQLAVDPRRLYLAGFSGTARAAWSFAFRLDGHVAGIIGVGGGLPASFAPVTGAVFRDSGVAFFGSAGNTDFNHDEMVEMETTLDAVGLPHRIAFFPGPHRWFPAPLAAESLDWMELQAIRAGLRAPDPAWTDALYARRFRAAWKADSAGAAFTALAAYRSLVADFRGVRDTAPAAARAAELEQSREVREVRGRRRKLAARADAYGRTLRSFLEQVRDAKRPPSVDAGVERLDLPELKAAAADPDTVAALPARRLLESAYVALSFYEPRDYLRQGRPAHALFVLSIADRIEPRSLRVCAGLARAYVQLQRNGEALEALRCAAASPDMPGPELAHFLEEDAVLNPLKADPEFRALLARLRRVPR